MRNIHFSVEFPVKMRGISKIKHIKAITHLNSTQFETYTSLSPSIKTKAKKLHLSVQFPRKIPGISKIKHISAIIHQNSTKFETYAPLSPSIKTKLKNCTYVCSFPANYLASLKSDISQPLFIRIQPNLKVKLP